jgi:hypothetical protein
MTDAPTRTASLHEYGAPMPAWRAVESRRNRPSGGSGGCSKHVAVEPDDSSSHIGRRRDSPIAMCADADPCPICPE